MALRDRLAKAFSVLAGDDEQDRPKAAQENDDAPNPKQMEALLRKVLPEPTEEKPRSLFHDPYAVLDWGGWREKPTSINFETLRQMAQQCGPIAAIIQVRTDQMAAFAKPQQGKWDKGYRVMLRDRRDQKRVMTKVEAAQAAEIERMIETTGVLLPNEHAADRDSFRMFVKKFVRDALVYDQICHPAGTMVQMADGTVKPIEAVEPGDMVWTHEGRVRRVVDTFQRSYTGLLFKLRARAQEIEATSGHPLLVEKNHWAHLSGQERNSDVDWVAAEDVREGMYLSYPEPIIEDVVSEFAGRPLTEDLARFLGLYVAEGHRQSSAVTFTFHEDEEDLRLFVERVGQALGADTQRVPYKHRAAEGVRLNCGSPVRKSKGACPWLPDALVEACGDGASSKRVPVQIVRAPRAVRRAFLAGYLQGDGHIRPTGANFGTVSENLFHGLRLLLAGEGIYAALTITPFSETHGWSDAYRAQVSGAAWRAFAERELGVPRSDKAVREPCLRRNGRLFLRVNSVEQREVVDLPVFNLEVEEDHSYLANGFTSHNCFEKIRDRRGKVSRLIMVPSETIRPAVADIEHIDAEEMRERVSHVQIFEDTVIAEYSPDDIAWCVKNPRSDLRVNTFGFSPVEQVTNLVTSWLFGFTYNQKVFTNGASIPGILNIKGAIPDRQLKSFRRMWYSMVAGVGNAFRTPILNSEDLQWIPMRQTNSEMEYAAWMDWLTKLICAVFQIDPTEINFIFGNTGQKAAMGNARPNEDEVVESKDKGLMPLAEFIEDSLNRHIVWDLNPDFEFCFAGLNAKEEEKQREAWEKEAKTYKTVNEVRAEQDMDPLDAGDIILDSVYLQASQGGGQGGGGEGGGDSDPLENLKPGHEEEDDADESDDEEQPGSEEDQKEQSDEEAARAAKPLFERAAKSLDETLAEVIEVTSAPSLRKARTKLSDFSREELIASIDKTLAEMEASGVRPAVLRKGRRSRPQRGR